MVQQQKQCYVYEQTRTLAVGRGVHASIFSPGFLKIKMEI
jgi:hypothetical protein